MRIILLIISFLFFSCSLEKFERNIHMDDADDTDKAEYDNEVTEPDMADEHYDHDGISFDEDQTIDEDAIFDEDVTIDEDIGLDEDIDSNDEDVFEGRFRWSYNVGASTYIYYSSVALSADNSTIFFGTSVKIRSDASRKDALIALNRNGTKKWEYKLSGGEEVRSTPVVSDGRVCFLADYRTGEFSKTHTKLFCLNEATGTLAFVKTVSDNTGMSSMGLSKVVVSSSKIFVIMKYVYVFDITDGSELYKSDQLQSFDNYVNPVVMGSEVMFILGGTLYFISISDYSTRTVDISLLNNSAVLATPALDSLNNIYFGNRYGKVFAIKNDGTLLWKRDFNPENNSNGPFVGSSVAIDESLGQIYFGTKGNNLSRFVALDIATGQTKWEYVTGRDIYSSPLIGSAGTIYFGSEDRFVYALKPDGSLLWKEGVFQDITWPSPAMDNKGVIYIGGMGDGAKNGKIYAIQTDCSGMKTGVWSKIHKNNQNTGK